MPNSLPCRCPCSDVSTGRAATPVQGGQPRQYREGNQGGQPRQYREGNHASTGRATTPAQGGQPRQHREGNHAPGRAATPVQGGQPRQYREASHASTGRATTPVQGGQPRQYREGSHARGQPQCRIQVFFTSYPHRHGAIYCVSQLRAFPSYGHCLNLHCPDKGGLTAQLGRQEGVFDNISEVANIVWICT